MRINELTAWFVLYIQRNQEMGLLDINLIAEDILVDIFREMYGYDQLVNLNQEQGNYPDIDLVDKESRVARVPLSYAPSGLVHNRQRLSSG